VIFPDGRPDRSFFLFVFIVTAVQTLFRTRPQTMMEAEKYIILAHNGKVHEVVHNLTR
jgi:hypothetical protein